MVDIQLAVPSRYAPVFAFQQRQEDVVKAGAVFARLQEFIAYGIEGLHCAVKFLIVQIQPAFTEPLDVYKRQAIFCAM